VNADTVVKGTVAPGTHDVEDRGTLVFTGSLTFSVGSVFDCHASSRTVLDKLTVSGPVVGTCQVNLSKAVGAVPLRQVIVDGNAASDYASFTPGGPCLRNWELSVGGTGDLLATDMAGDSDGDGLPDWWETAFFLTRTNAVRSRDSDMDRLSNWEEFVAGTDPTNRASVFKITAVGYQEGAGVEVVWTSASNRLYTLERTADLISGTYTVAASNLVACPPANAYIDVMATGVGERFYRVVVEREW